ncbi:hypothetical protein J6Y73_05740 [bacterium]|nr:hypothetical protein [bacterium]
MFFSSLSEIINWQNIIAFFLGIVAGMTILFSIAMLIIARGKKKVKKTYIPTMEELSNEKVRELIANKQKDFIIAVEENDADYFKTCFSLTLELLHEISSYYFPNSKYPEYELTVNEASELIHYIVDQVINTLDRPLLKRLKDTKISTIVSGIEKGKKATKSKTFKAASEGAEVFKESRAIINTINPIYWFRRLVIEGTANIAIKKICKSELSIAGREFNKVYSKNLFKNTENDTDKIIKEDIEEIFNDEV